MIFELFVFWCSMALLVYTYIGYPLILYIWAYVSRYPYQNSNDYEPAISIIVVAYNEADNVKSRLDNFLAIDYPKERMEIILASDGSTDATVTLAKSYAGQGVRVVEFKTRRGKPAVLNELIPELTGDIVVLADMRQQFQLSAIRSLVAPFTDSTVGAVTGELFLTGGKKGSAAGEGIGFYWKYEKFIRHYETCVDSTIGVTGAIYAIRRVLFKPIATDTLIDDVLIPMIITFQGYRVVYEPAARAYDDMVISAGKEFTRKIRTISGNFQLLIRERWLLSSALNRLWFQTISHKFCRLLCPPCLLLVLIANYRLVDIPGYRVLFVLQIVFYLAAYTGYASEMLARKSPLINVPYTFCLLNLATVIAFFRYIFGRQLVTWTKGTG